VCLQLPAYVILSDGGLGTAPYEVRGAQGLRAIPVTLDRRRASALSPAAAPTSSFLKSPVARSRDASVHPEASGYRRGRRDDCVELDAFPPTPGERQADARDPPADLLRRRQGDPRLREHHHAPFVFGWSGRSATSTCPTMRVSRSRARHRRSPVRSDWRRSVRGRVRRGSDPVNRARGAGPLRPQPSVAAAAIHRKRFGVPSAGHRLSTHLSL